MFGSYSKDASAEDSDIDLVVDFSETVDLFTYAHLIEDVQNLFNKRVDMITVQGIKPALKNRILSEVEWIERS
ncbi:MAG: nucleotidyltransferase family protein [Anaerolineaceae bacterium]